MIPAEFMDTLHQFIIGIDKNEDVVYLNRYAQIRLFSTEEKKTAFPLSLLLPEADASHLIEKLFLNSEKELGLSLVTQEYTVIPVIVNTYRDDKLLYLVGRDQIEENECEFYVKKSLNQAEHVNKRKSEFLASISHEIRTPMNTILGFTELLLSTEINSIQRDYLEMIEISAHSLLDIINDILDFAKLESGKFTLVETPCNLRNVVGSIIKTMVFEAMKKNIDLMYTFDEKVPEALVTDPLRLRQILINLIGNAIKFTQQGKVTLYVSLTEDRKFVKFSVHDTGSGIPEDKRELLFHEFYQADPNISRRYNGTGLGLAISKRLTELMGGEISVESKEGVGSVFTFTILLKIAENDDSEEEITEIYPLEDYYPEVNVLLAEDYYLNQKLISALLAKKGLGVSIAATGKEVLEKLEISRYDIILMDMHMPEMGGIDATQVIRNAEKTTGMHIPIIALTANAFDEDKQKCLDAGMDDFVSKPVEPEILYQIILKYANKPISSRNIAHQPLVTQKLKDESYFDFHNFKEIDQDSLDTLLEYLMSDLVLQIDLLGQALAGRKVKDVHYLAHKLKGCLSNINAEHGISYALAIENAGKTGNLDVINDEYENLKDIVLYIVAKIKEYHK